jgi:hypothetical protein
MAMSRILELQIPFDTVLGLETLDPDYGETLMTLVEKQPHAKFALLLYTSSRMILEAQKTLEQFATFAWGSVPDKVERWRNTGEEWRENQDETEE